MPEALQPLQNPKSSNLPNHPHDHLTEAAHHARESLAAEGIDDSGG
jgi:hypothetical protein